MNQYKGMYEHIQEQRVEIRELNKLINSLFDRIHKLEEPEPVSPKPVLTESTCNYYISQNGAKTSCGNNMVFIDESYEHCPWCRRRIYPIGGRR